MITCPNCGREHEDTVKICVCGEALSLESTTTHVFGDTDFEEGRPQWGTARFNPRNRLIVSERDSKISIFSILTRLKRLLSGGLTPDTGDAPDIDLGPYQGG